MKKLLAILTAVVLLFSVNLVPVSAAATSVEILAAYADGDKVYVTAEILGEFSEATLSLAGAEKATANYEADKTIYSFSAVSDYYGNIEAKVSADGVSDSEVLLCFEKTAEVDYSATLNTFDSMDAGAIAAGTYDLNGGNTKIVTVTGKTTATITKSVGTNADSCIVFERLTGDSASANIRKFFATGDTSGTRKKISSGIAEISFDAYLYNTKGDISIYPRSNSGDYWMFDGEQAITIFGTDGYIAGTTTPIQTETWYETKLIIDLSNNVYALIINDHIVKTGSATVSSTSDKLYYFDIYAGKNSGQRYTKVAFDNIGTASYSKALICAVDYKSAAGDMKETDVVNPSVYLGTEQIDVTFTTALESPTVKIDGVAVEASVSGNTISVAPVSLSEGKHYISITSESLSKETRVYFDAVKETGILYPANGAVISQGESITLKAMAPGAASVKFFVDDAEYAAAESDEDIFTATVPTSEIAFGKRKVTMRSVGADGIEEMQTVYFTYSKEITANVSFGNLDTYNDTTETVTMGNGSFARTKASTTIVGGKSALETDKAVQSNAYAALTTMATATLTNALTGTIVFEHDVKLESNSAIVYEFNNGSQNYCAFHTQTWNPVSYVAGNGVDAKYSIADNSWHTLRYTLDLSSKTWNLSVDGNNVIKDFVATIHADRYTALKKITFKAIGTVAVDNPKLYNIYSLPALSDVTYNSDVAAWGDSLIPNTAQSVKLTFDKNFHTLTPDMVSAKVNGEAIALTNVAYADKVLSFDMPVVSAHSTLSITINGSALLAEGVTIGQGIDVTLYVANSELLYIEKSASTSASQHKGIVLTINGGSAREGVCVFASYTNDTSARLTSVSVTTLEIPAGENIISRVKEAGAGESAKIMLWDSTSTISPLE